MTETRYRLAGVLGSPIAQSKSPKLHRHWLRTYGISGDYVALPVEREDFATVVRTLPKMGFAGCNVTIPHKVAALELADQVTDRATLIGAANTLIFRPDGKIHADNTDGYGFISNLHQMAPDWSPTSGPAAVLGAGGAARAIIVSLLDAGTPEILLSNRTKVNAENLRAVFGSRITVVDWVHAGAMLAEAATVVNTTSMGMTGGPEFRLNLDHLRPQSLVTDLVYNPLETPILAAAAQIGCTTVDGLGMLLHQAVPGFERWFGQKPVVDAAARAAVLA